MISTIIEAVAYAKANAVPVYTYAPGSKTDIQECEKVIGYRLPNSYITFLKEFGYGMFGSFHIDGLKSGAIKEVSPRNALTTTLELHGTGDLPKDMFVFENLDDGSYACLRLSEMREGECPVVEWEYGVYVRDNDPEPYRVLADSFNTYFIQKTNQQVEWEKEG